jgi:hypothetical protein
MAFIPSVISAIKFVLDLSAEAISDTGLQNCFSYSCSILFDSSVVHQDIKSSLALLNAALGCDYDGNINVDDNWDGWTSAFSKVFFP